MRDKLKMIENELVPVYETDRGEKVVYGTELHVVLQVKTKYTDWISRRFSECDAVENEDFQTCFSNLGSENHGGQNKKEHIIQLDTAKEMAMLERNDIGKQVRRYFIRIEKKYKQLQKPKSALQILQDAMLEVDKKIETVNEDLQEFKKDIPLLGLECQQITRAKNQKIVPLLGGKDAPAYKDVSLRGKVYRDINQQICREFDVDTYKAIKRNQIDSALKIIKDYQLPLVLSEQIRNVNCQMSFL